MKKVLEKLFAALLVVIMGMSLALLSSQNSKAESGVDIIRLNNIYTGEHLYTSDMNEVNTLSRSGIWENEGAFWKAPTSGTGVYRLNNPGGFHLYTMDQNEIRTLKNRGWQVDNGGLPLFYSGGSEDIYRLHNGRVGYHLLTSDKNEYNSLSKNGWTAEGVALKAQELVRRQAPAPSSNNNIEYPLLEVKLSWDPGATEGYHEVDPGFVVGGRSIEIPDNKNTISVHNGSGDAVAFLEFDPPNAPNSCRVVILSDEANMNLSFGVAPMAMLDVMSSDLKVEIYENGRLVKTATDNELNIYRSYTGYRFAGICSYKNGVLGEYDATWLEELFDAQGLDFNAPWF